MNWVQTLKVSIPAISGIPEVLAAVKRGDWIGQESFFTICKVIGVTDSPGQAESMFESLQSADKVPLDDEKEDTGTEGAYISSQILVQFVELWSGADDTEADVLAGRVEFEEGEAVLKATQNAAIQP
jgi:hypothetical protein